MSSDDVVAALREHATALSASDPADPPEDPPVDAFDAEVYGLGEVTHGTRECARGKHRLLRWLVAERGVRTLAFEEDVATMLVVDAHVRDDDGALDDAVADLRAWPWRVESVRDTFEWVRTFNEGRPADDQVRVRGLDMSDPSVPARPLLSHLLATDVVPVPNDLQTLAASEGPPADDDERDHYLTRSEGAASAVAGRLADDREAYVEATSEADWALARRLADAVVENCEWHRVRHEQDGPSPEGMAHRDRYMADGVEWCVEHDPGAVAVWAHNSHVKRGTFDDDAVWSDVETMGNHLADRFGDDYRPLGFDAGHGSFRAFDGAADGTRTVRTFEFDGPLSGSATARFDELSGPCLVDLQAAGDDERLAGWLDDPQRVRWVGSVYDPDASPGHHYMETDLGEAYDLLWYLPASTPTVPLDD